MPRGGWAKAVKILVCDDIAQEGVEKLREAGEVVVHKPADEDDLVAKVEELEDLAAIVVRSGTKITRRAIEAAAPGRLQIIARAGVGVDNIDVEAATAHGIIVVNSPEGNTRAAAEHAIALMLALSRNIPRAYMALKERRWSRAEFLGTEVKGKVLGIIGLGKIGREVARMAKGLDMICICHDPALSAEWCRQFGVEPMSFNEVLNSSDYISLHVPLNRQTKHLIGAEEMALMKPGVRIINTSRGGVIDEAALAEALQDGRVGGAALDVFETEPKPWESPIMEAKNVIFTPHLGASTKEAQVAASLDVAEQVVEVLRGGQARSAVNMPAIPAEQRASLGPYIALAERLGGFLAQMSDAGLRSVEMEYAGGLLQYDCSLLTRAVLMGIFSRQLEQRANLINAPVIARERGIRFDERRSGAPVHYYSLMTVRCVFDDGTQEAAGTLRGIDEPRIVLIGPYRVDVVPQGTMLLLSYQDRPGVIGRVGTFLGHHGINIGQMHVGRNEPGGEAIMILTVDDPVPEEVAGEIRGFDWILSIRKVEL